LRYSRSSVTTRVNASQTVKHVNRVLLWDWSPTAITAFGASSATYGVNNSNSGFT